jgi:APA family basic amino acid/polyamine antiporter
MGVIFNLGMMLTLEWQNWARLFGWLAIGILIYFIYGKKNSVLNSAMSGK